MLIVWFYVCVYCSVLLYGGDIAIDATNGLEVYGLPITIQPA